MTDTVRCNLDSAHTFSCEVALALAAAKPGPLGAAAAFKAAFDASKCLAIENNNAVSAAGHVEAAAYCAADGGTVTGVAGDTTYCKVPEGSL